MNPFFMNDLLNFFNESVTNNLTCILPGIENLINQSERIVFSGEIGIDSNLIKSLEECKFSIKEQYRKNIQVGNDNKL